MNLKKNRSEFDALRLLTEVMVTPPEGAPVPDWRLWRVASPKKVDRRDLLERLNEFAAARRVRARDESLT